MRDVGVGMLYINMCVCVNEVRDVRGGSMCGPGWIALRCAALSCAPCATLCCVRGRAGFVER